MIVSLRIGLMLWLFPLILTAQSPERSLELAGGYYERDQLDSASYYFQQAYQTEAAGIRIQALAGLAKVAIYRSEMAMADSFLQLGDQLLSRAEIQPLNRWKYQTVKGEYFRKNSQFEQALRQHQQVVAESRSVEAGALIHAYGLYYTALTFERLTLYDSSLWYVNQAYSIFQEQLDTNSVEFSNIYNGLGACYQRANRLAEAKAFYLRSKTISENKLGPVSGNLAMVLNNLSGISRSEENYQEAIAYSQQALKIYRALQDEQGISGAYYALGIYHYYLGDYGRTKDLMQACIHIRERLFSPTHFSLIGPYEVLGIAHEESGDYENTLHYLRKVREMIMANFASGSIPEAYNYENTALCFKSIGKLDSALYYIQLANTILPEQLPENDYAQAVHYFSYANILYQLDALEKADLMLRHSNRIYEINGLHTSSEYALNLALQGLMLAEQEKWEEAESKFAQALNNVRSRVEEPPFQMTPNALSLLNEYTKFLYQKYQAEPHEKTLQVFNTYADHYLQLSDKFRKQFADPYTKSILIKDNSEVYNRNIGIFNQLYRQSKKTEYLIAAYQFSEYGRTSMLRDLQDDKISTYAGIPDSVLQEELSLKKRITRLNQEILENADSSQLRENLLAVKEALNKHIDHTLRNYPRYHELKFSSRIPSIAELQDQLSDDHNLIEYMQDDTAYYALVLTPRTSELVHLGHTKVIDQAIQDWKNSMVDQDELIQHTAGQILYQHLWRSLEGLLTGDRISIVPVGRLFYLNFEALPTATDTYLIRDYNLSYALSFTVLFSKVEKNDTESLLAIAPGFEEALKIQYQSQLDTLEQLDNEYLQTVRQPWSLKLVNKLKQQFLHQAFTGLQATEANIKANLHKGNVLYFGTHAIADPADPLRSKLILTKEIGPQKEDGYLHAYELYGLPLQADLAILNACESGLGKLQKGEGMISLAYSIHYAGCPSTIMSLWKVDERISTRITGDFLQYLDQGFSTSQALRQAKLDYLDQAETTQLHPFYWAGMVLMGKDGLVQLRKKKSNWPVYAGLAILLLIGMYQIVRSRHKIENRSDFD